MAGRLTFVTEAPTCGLRFQIGGSVFICRAEAGHPCDPDRGYFGSGHVLVGVEHRDD